MRNESSPWLVLPLYVLVIIDIGFFNVYVEETFVLTSIERVFVFDEYIMSLYVMVYIVY